MTDDWFNHYTEKGVALERLDDGTVRWIGRRRSPSLDLAGVPGGESIEIRIADPNSPRVTLTGGRARHRVIIRQPIDVVVQGGRVGTVEFDLSATLPRRNDASLQGEAEEVCAAKGKVRIDADIGRLVLAGGVPEGDFKRVGEFVIRGSVSIPSRLGLVRVEPGAVINVSHSRGPVIAMLRLPTGSEDTPSLQVAGKPTPAQKTAGLTIGEIAGNQVHISIDKVDLTVRKITSNAVTVSGSGRVTVPPGAEVTDLNLERKVTLVAGAGSAVRRFSGRLHVEACQHASIVAAPKGSYQYVGTTGRDRTGTEALEGATLRRVLIRDTAAGRRFLQSLRSASVVEPIVDQLRVRQLSWRWPLVSIRRLRRDQDQLQHVDDAAFFAQELAGLVSDKSGSGSIRTRSSWAAYRGRHLTAESPWERLALGLFRLVGYGQRPGPAALCWIALAAVASPIEILESQEAWVTFSLRSLDEAAEQALTLLLSPFVLLRLAGDPSLAPISDPSGLLTVLLHTVVAIPFAFFVVAVSRFLKADWPFLSR